MVLENFRIKNIAQFLIENKLIFVFVILLSLLPMIFHNTGFAWITTILALFTSIANNSFQIFGTFFLINKKTPKWKMFLFIFGVFAVIILASWFLFNKELHFGKLNSIPYNNNLNIFHFLSPFVLIYLTHKKIPVSSTFLFTTLFSSGAVVHTILTKTIHIYILSFVFGFVLWKYIYPFFATKIQKYMKSELLEMNNEKFWFTMQYISTALLWFSWLFSNMSSALVFIPRQFDIKSLGILLLFSGIIIYYLIDNMGGNMQQLIKNKKNTDDIKSATMINIVYGCLIYIFQFSVNIPISTTWVFIGLIAGREIAITSSQNILIVSEIIHKNSVKRVIFDLLHAVLGVIISLGFAMISKVLITLF